MSGNRLLGEGWADKDYGAVPHLPGKLAEVREGMGARCEKCMAMKLELEAVRAQLEKVCKVLWPWTNVGHGWTRKAHADGSIVCDAHEKYGLAGNRYQGDKPWTWRVEVPGYSRIEGEAATQVDAMAVADNIAQALGCTLRQP